MGGVGGWVSRPCVSRAISASWVLLFLLSLFFIRLKERSFPGLIFLAVPSLAWRGGWVVWLGV